MDEASTGLMDEASTGLMDEASTGLMDEASTGLMAAKEIYGFKHWDNHEGYTWWEVGRA